MKTCLACAMPLLEKKDFAQGDENSQFCWHCVNKDGIVKTCEEIFNGGVCFFTETVGLDKKIAEKFVRKNMNSLAYWQNKICDILKGEQTTDEEFQEVLQKLQG
jgi:hypothetical protein